MTTRNKIEKIIHEEIESLLKEKELGFAKKKSAELKQDLAQDRRETGKAGITNVERGSAEDLYKKHMKAAEFINTETGTLARLMTRVRDLLAQVIAKKSKEGEVAPSPSPSATKLNPKPKPSVGQVPPTAPRPKL